MACPNPEPEYRRHDIAALNDDVTHQISVSGQFGDDARRAGRSVAVRPQQRRVVPAPSHLPAREAARVTQTPRDEGQRRESSLPSSQFRKQL